MDKKILLIEDDQFLREINIETLQLEGFQITPAIDGEDALDKIKNNQFDLILLDIVIPKINGIELVQRLKSENIEVKCPIIFLTNMDEGKETQEARALGNEIWIKSDMTPLELVQKVKDILKKVM